MLRLQENLLLQLNRQTNKEGGVYFADWRLGDLSVVGNGTRVSPILNLMRCFQVPQRGCIGAILIDEVLANAIFACISIFCRKRYESRKFFCSQRRDLNLENIHSGAIFSSFMRFHLEKS